MALKIIFFKYFFNSSIPFSSKSALNALNSAKVECSCTHYAIYRKEPENRRKKTRGRRDKKRKSIKDAFRLRWRLFYRHRRR